MLRSKVEVLTPPPQAARFAFWGHAAKLQLSESGPEVLLEYLTEPPHGDPQYQITVDRVVVGGWKRPTGFFGRDLHLSQCGRLLAATSLESGASWFHVIDVEQSRIASWRGFVRLEHVSLEALMYLPYEPTGSGVKLGEPVRLELSAAAWRPLVDRDPG